MSTDIDTPVQDRLATLKHRADMLGVTYHPSIGVEKLQEKVNAAMADAPEVADDQEEVVAAAPAETDNQRRKRLIDEARKLIRIRVTCMDPSKSEYEGEFFTAGNSVVGSYTKFVPFNAEDGWHVPNIIYKQIVARQAQIFQTIVDSRGNRVRQGKLIKAFNVEVLPALTEKELGELARRQAMAKSVD